jgi:uncharacterized pyridoxal phosphate-containing UPF0001 family protein
VIGAARLPPNARQEPVDGHDDDFEVAIGEGATIVRVGRRSLARA